MGGWGKQAISPAASSLTRFLFPNPFGKNKADLGVVQGGLTNCWGNYRLERSGFKMGDFKSNGKGANNKRRAVFKPLALRSLFQQLFHIILDFSSPNVIACLAKVQKVGHYFSFQAAILIQKLGANILVENIFPIVELGN